MRWNVFHTVPSRETAFQIEEDQNPILSQRQNPILSQRIYLKPPDYLKDRKAQPSFTLVSDGSHISSFFKYPCGLFVGDYKGQLLIIVSEDQFKSFILIQTDFKPSEGRTLIWQGKYSELTGGIIQEHRKEAQYECGSL